MKALFICLTVLATTLVYVDPVNLLKPVNKVESWRLEQAGDAKGEMKIEEECVVFRTTVIDSTDWHVQAVQTDLDLKDGKSYTIKFKARSPEEVTITLNAMIDKEDWHQIGLNEEVQLRKEFSDFKFDFTADSTVSKKNRISFVLGSAKGIVYIKELTLTAK